MSFLQCCEFSTSLLSVVISVSDSNLLKACIWHSRHRAVAEKYISTIQVGIQVTTMQHCKGGTEGQMVWRHQCPPWRSMCLDSGSPGSNLVSEWFLTAVDGFPWFLQTKARKLLPFKPRPLLSTFLPVIFQHHPIIHCYNKLAVLLNIS